MARAPSLTRFPGRHSQPPSPSPCRLTDLSSPGALLIATCIPYPRIRPLGAPASTCSYPEVPAWLAWLPERRLSRNAGGWRPQRSQSSLEPCPVCASRPVSSQHCIVTHPFAPGQTEADLAQSFIMSNPPPNSGAGHTNATFTPQPTTTPGPAAATTTAANATTSSSAAPASNQQNLNQIVSSCFAFVFPITAVGLASVPLSTYGRPSGYGKCSSHLPVGSSRLLPFT